MLWISFGKNMDIITMELSTTWKKPTLKKLNNKKEINKKIRKSSNSNLEDKLTMISTN